MARVPTWDRRYDSQPYPGNSAGWLLLTELGPGDTLQRVNVAWHWYFPSSAFVVQDYYTSWIVSVAITYASLSFPPPFPQDPADLPIVNDTLYWDSATMVHNSLTNSTYYTVPWDPPGLIDTKVQRGPVEFGAAVWLAWGNNNVQHNQGWAVRSSVLVLRDPTAASPAWGLSRTGTFGSMEPPPPDSEVSP